MDYVDNYRVPRKGEHAVNIKSISVEGFVILLEEARELAATKIPARYKRYCERFHGKTLVKPYYDWDHQVSCEADIVAGRGAQLDALQEIMELLHPGAVIAYADRSGYNGEKKYWKISLRAFVQGVKIRSSHIPLHAKTVLGVDGVPAPLDLTVYKDGEQLLATIYCCKTTQDTRLLDPVGDDMDVEGFGIRGYLVQDVEGCKELVVETAPVTDVVVAPRAPLVAGTPPGSGLRGWLASQFRIMEDEVLTDKLMPYGGDATGRTLIVPTACKHCPFLQKPHASNQGYITISMPKTGKKVFVNMKCHDKESCAGKSQRSHDPMPDALVKELKQGLKSTRADAEQLESVFTALQANDALIRQMDLSVTEQGIRPTGLWECTFGKNRYCPVHQTMHDCPQNYGVAMADARAGICCNIDRSKIYPQDYIHLPSNVVNLIYNNNTTVINITAEKGPVALPDFHDLDAVHGDDETLNVLFRASLISSTYVVAEYIHGLLQRSMDYVYTTGRWMKYNDTNKLWHKAQGPDTFIIKKVVPIYQALADKYAQTGDEAQAKWLGGLVTKLSNSNTRQAFIADIVTISTEVAESDVLFDGPTVLGFTNGVLDLETLTFRPHRKEDFLTRNISYAFPTQSDPVVRGEIMQFLKSCFPDERNSVEIAFLLQVLGMTLDTRNRNQIFVVFKGSGGNGKGVLKSLMYAVFEFYHTEPSAAFLTSERPSDESPAPNIVALRKVRSVFCSEPEHGKKINASFVRFITGGDLLRVRNNHSNEMVEFVPVFVLFVLCNQVPLFNMGLDDSTAVERRMLTFEFEMEFRDDPDPDNPRQRKKDPTLVDRIVTWAPEMMLILVEEFSRYRSSGYVFTRPERIISNTREQMEENNPFERFVRERMEKEPHGKIHVKRLVETYDAWLKDQRESDRVGSTAQMSKRCRNKQMVVEKSGYDLVCCKSNTSTLIGWKFIS